MKLGTGVIKVDYGAFELKKSYQKHMIYAMLLGLGIHLFAMGVWMFVSWVKSTSKPETVGGIVIRDISDLQPPPSIAQRAPSVKIEAPKIAAPRIGIPEPVPDEEADQSVVLATQDQLAEITQPVIGHGDGSGDNIIIDIPDDEFFPAPDEFVAVEELPVAIFLAQPDYPEMARRASMEADVWVKVLVDKQGDVRDAMVVKVTVQRSGFEEKALEAARKGRWTPAMQNNQPVSLWVTYKIEFRLH